MNRLSRYGWEDLVVIVLLCLVLWCAFPHLVIFGLTCGMWLAWASVGWVVNVQDGLFQRAAGAFSLIVVFLLMVALAAAARFISRQCIRAWRQRPFSWWG